MPDLFQIVNALQDKQIFSPADSAELMGSTFRPRLNEVVGALAEKGILEDQDVQDLANTTADTLYERLQQKGVLE